MTAETKTLRNSIHPKRNTLSMWVNAAWCVFRMFFLPWNCSAPSPISGPFKQPAINFLENNRGLVILFFCLPASFVSFSWCAPIRKLRLSKQRLSKLVIVDHTTTLTDLRPRDQGAHLRAAALPRPGQHSRGSRQRDQRSGKLDWFY